MQLEGKLRKKFIHLALEPAALATTLPHAPIEKTSQVKYYPYFYLDAQ
jgi:hypothetical protein